MNEPATTPIRALILLTDAFLSRHGCFPLDVNTPEQREWHQAMSIAYSLVGPPGSMMRTAALRAGIRDGSDWTYLATCLEMHADKFPVPDHMRNYAKKLRELGLEGAGVRELATHLADIVNHSIVTSPAPDNNHQGVVYTGIDLSSLEDMTVVTHSPGYVPTIQTAPPIPTVPNPATVDVTFPEAKLELKHQPVPEGTPLFKVIRTDNFGREGPGHDDKWILSDPVPMEYAEQLARWLNQQHATSSGDYWAAVVPADYKLQIFEP